jgi:hypothetical protein
LITGNKVTLLIDGPAAMEAMFAAIRRAEDHINIETFSVADDDSGRRFAEVLLQKQAEGVQVNLLYDSVGSFPAPSVFFQRLRDGGIQVREFNPINPFRVRGDDWRLSHRDHRRIVIVDGKIAFSGSSNLSNLYTSIHQTHLAGDSGNETENPFKRAGAISTCKSKGLPSRCFKGSSWKPGHERTDLSPPGSTSRLCGARGTMYSRCLRVRQGGKIVSRT